jgi:uncharacterized protein (TIGR03067 family)
MRAPFRVPFARSAALMALCFISLIACPMLVARATQEVDVEQEKLQGKWNVESFEFNGSDVEAMKDAVREFKDHRYTLTPTSSDVISGTIKLDSMKTPKEIDLEVNGRTLKGIYELDGDTLKLCYALEGDQRPKELASEPNSGVVLVVHKKAK